MAQRRVPELGTIMAQKLGINTTGTNSFVRTEIFLKTKAKTGATDGMHQPTCYLKGAIWEKDFVPDLKTITIKDTIGAPDLLETTATI